MENNMPPVSNPFATLIQLAYVASELNERKEPHIVFLAHDVSNRMSSELKKKNVSFEAFVMEACVEYLNKIDQESISIDRYFGYSDLQLSEYLPDYISTQSTEEQVVSLKSSLAIKKSRRTSKDIKSLPIKRKESK